MLYIYTHIMSGTIHFHKFLFLYVVQFLALHTSGQRIFDLDLMSSPWPNEKEIPKKEVVSLTDSSNDHHPKFHFIFGFSTGHVGTTSFSKGSLYGEPHNIVFMHESQHGYFKCSNVGSKLWRNFTFDDEYVYVKNLLYPCLSANFLKTNHTVIDLGHQNLYYMDALVKFLSFKKQIRYVVVRIRRNRYETAISLTFKQPNLQYSDLCSHFGLAYRYCPFDREAEVILKPPSRAVWDKFTVYQQALWMVDEVEARWKLLLTQYPHMKVREISWSKNISGSFDNAASVIAKLIGVKHAIHVEEAFVIDNEHATNTLVAVLDESQLHIQDLSYRAAMRYGTSFSPG